MTVTDVAKSEIYRNSNLVRLERQKKKVKENSLSKIKYSKDKREQII